MDLAAQTTVRLASEQERRAARDRAFRAAVTDLANRWVLPDSPLTDREALVELMGIVDPDWRE